jgi:hypothetical protein
MAPIDNQSHREPAFRGASADKASFPLAATHAQALDGNLRLSVSISQPGKRICLPQQGGWPNGVCPVRGIRFSFQFGPFPNSRTEVTLNATAIVPLGQTLGTASMCRLAA